MDLDLDDTFRFGCEVRPEDFVFLAIKVQQVACARKTKSAPLGVNAPELARRGGSHRLATGRVRPIGGQDADATDPLRPWRLSRLPGLRRCNLLRQSDGLVLWRAARLR